MKDKYHRVMMQTAINFAAMSYCERRKVGAVLAKDNRILATGYNGTITGHDNCCEEFRYICPSCKDDVTKSIKLKETDCWYCGATIAKTSWVGTRYTPLIKKHVSNKTNDFTLHAEQNIITYCAKEGIPTRDTTMYITTSPCKNCAKLIAQSGIKHILYKEKYKDTSGIDFLKEVGVEVNQLTID